MNIFVMDLWILISMVSTKIIYTMLVATTIKNTMSIIYLVLCKSLDNGTGLSKNCT